MHSDICRPLLPTQFVPTACLLLPTQLAPYCLHSLPPYCLHQHTNCEYAHNYGTKPSCIISKNRGSRKENNSWQAGPLGIWLSVHWRIFCHKRYHFYRAIEPTYTLSSAWRGRFRNPLPPIKQLSSCAVTPFHSTLPDFPRISCGSG